MAKEEDQELEKETYPVKGDDVKKLHNKADEFLDKIQKEEEEKAEATKPKRVRKEKEEPKEEPELETEEQDEEVLTQEEEINEAEHEEEGIPEEEESETPVQPDRTAKRVVRKPVQQKKTNTVVTAGLLAIGMVVGMVGTHLFLLPQDHNSTNHPDSSDQIKEELVIENIKEVAPSDSIYGIGFKVVDVNERVDGLYVTFQAENNGQYPVYMMSQTIKMIGSDGQLYLPEIGKGELPSTFTGGGLPTGTSDQATLVFATPKGVQAQTFILENVTNMKNGSFSFQINMP